MKMDIIVGSMLLFLMVELAKFDRPKYLILINRPKAWLSLLRNSNYGVGRKVIILLSRVRMIV